ncbi:hypothetical protein FOL46_005132 [Perkinsus olseni]|nr:hypothetical protein FOL46_005132 [Perkinsus olseni]
MEERRRVAVRSMMEPEALERLNRIGLVKPEKQRAVESLIIQSAQSGRLQQRIDEGTLVELLEHVEKQSGGAGNIKFARRAFDDDDDSDIDLDNLDGPRRIAGNSRRSPSRRNRGGGVVTYYHEISEEWNSYRPVKPAQRLVASKKFAPSQRMQGGTANIQQVYDPEHLIVGASHSKTAKKLVDSDPVLHEIVVDAIRYAATQFHAPRGHTAQLKKEAGGNDDAGLAGYLDFSRLVCSYLHTLANESDPVHRELLNSSTVVVGNMGFCGNIPYKLKMGLPEHYVDPYRHLTNVVPYICTAFHPRDSVDEPHSAVNNDSTVGTLQKTGRSKSAQLQAVVEGKCRQASQTKVLALRECALRSLPEDACNMEDLRTLDLAFNRLTTLPKEVDWHASLLKLNLSSNQLKEVPSSLVFLIKLQSLQLQDNKIEKVGGYAFPGSLVELNLSNNKLSHIGEEVFETLNALTDVDVSGNQLQTIPTKVLFRVASKTLTTVEAEHNKIIEIQWPDNGGDVQLDRLTHMDLSYNRLSTVPSELFTNTALVDLWLQGNNPDRLNKYTIKEIPGFSDYVDRRKRKIDKRIDSKAGSKLNLAMCGLE